jgi:para-nitrobenzyl esterase
MLIGSNAQEIPGPETPAEVREAIRRTYGPLADRALELYGLAGEGTGKTEPVIGGPGIQWATDNGFRCPATVQAMEHAAAGHPAYVYEFEHPKPSDKFQCHACELSFLFGTWPKDVQLAPIDRKLSEQMQAYWTNFARTGDPNGEGLPEWPKFTKDAQGYMAFTDNGAAAKAGLRRDYCELWRQAQSARDTK